MKALILSILVFVLCSCAQTTNLKRETASFFECDAETNAAFLMAGEGKIGVANLVSFNSSSNRAIVNYTNLGRGYCITIKYNNFCKVVSWDYESGEC